MIEMPPPLTPPKELAVRSRRRKTAGRCYELAWVYLDEHEDVPGLELVHGTVLGYIGHAWVEGPTDWVFDGVQQRFYNRDDYYRACGAKPIARFDLKGAIRATIRTRHFGPWHDEHVAGRSH
jgi:hypothetical protein